MREALPIKILIILLLLAPGYALAGQCGGFTVFAGYGYDKGPNNYSYNKDWEGGKYRDNHQGVYGLEYNFPYWRFQWLHSSSLDNGEKASFGDMNQANILFKWDF